MPLSRIDLEVMEGWSHGVSGSVVHQNRVIHVEHVWNTAITINVPGTAGREDATLAAIDECTRLFALVDETFSPFKAVSEVTLFRSGVAQPPSPEFTEVLDACRALRATTRGAFDPWSVPGGYDPSGFVKGWAVGRASVLLRERGFHDHLVNAGGDLCARGDEVPDTGAGWPVGILNPHAPTDVIQVVRLRDQAMATSGRYERGDHVSDPRTRAPAVEVDSATVVGPDPGVADAVASAALVDGRDSMRWFGDLGPGWSLHLVIGDLAHTYGSDFDRE
jgi:FAD:protein FMN transferase